MDSGDTAEGDTIERADGCVKDESDCGGARVVTAAVGSCTLQLVCIERRKMRAHRVWQCGVVVCAEGKVEKFSATQKRCMQCSCRLLSRRRVG